MHTKNSKKRKASIVIIDDSLEKYLDMPIFQDKVNRTNEIIRTVGLPKELKSKKKINRF